MEIQDLITAAILHRLRNPKREQRPKATIAELESMLNAPDDPERKVEILPDGSITVELPTYASDLAEAVMEALAAEENRTEVKCFLK